MNRKNMKIEVNKLIKVIGFVFLMLLIIDINAQGIPLPQNIQAPNTANLGKFGDVPVNLYSGTPNIGVPLYSMEEKGVKLDISLNYDASGVRVSSLPSWVGQNWSLNAGGVITRTSKNLPDEFYVPSHVGSVAGYGYFYPISHQRLNVSNWTDGNVLQSILETNYAPSSPTINTKESQPDIFTFNFMGFSGKFFMGEDGQWKVSSDSNLKIVINSADFTLPFNQQYIANTSDMQSKMIGKIEIIDDKGITYVFGSSPETIEYSKEFYGQRLNYWHANSWYLTKVKNHLGKVLYEFTYERGDYVAEFYNTSTHNIFNAVWEGGTLSGNSGGCYYSYGNNGIGGTLISPVYLKKIKSLSGKELLFNSQISNTRYYNSNSLGNLYMGIYSHLYSSGILNNPDTSVYANYFWHLRDYTGIDNIIEKFKWRALTSITGATSVTFQTNLLNYGGEHTNRFNLKGVTVEGKKYTFEYDRFEQLPDFMSRAIDHLGYYKGTEYTYPPTNHAGHYNERNTDADKVKIGSLIKIIYPTKGSSQFVYEPHKYKRYVNDAKTGLVTTLTESIIGGLRIKQIKEDDGKGTIATKTYKYVSNYSLNPNGPSSGILSNLPKYYWPDWRIRNAPGSYAGELSETVFSTNAIIPLGNFFGSPIGYSEVAEVSSDGSYVLYKYTNNEEAIYRDETAAATFNVSSSPYEEGNDRSLLRGKLKEKSIYNAQNILVQKTITSYSTNGSVKFAKGTNISGITCGLESYGYGFNRGNAYKLYYFDNTMIKEESFLYENGSAIKTTSSLNYEYYPSLASTNGDLFLQSEEKQVYLESTTTGNERNQTLYTYPFEFASAINTDLEGKRIFTPLIKENKKNNESVSKEQIEYGYFVPITNANYLLPQKIKSAKGSNALEENLIIDAYDNNGNVSKYHTKDGSYTLLVWGYNKRYPIIKIEGSDVSAAYAESKAVAVQSILDASTSAWTISHTTILDRLQEVRAYYSGNMVTTYTYNPYVDGVFTITDPRGYRLRYDYDSSKRLQYVKDADGNILKSYNYNYKTN